MIAFATFAAAGCGLSGKGILVFLDAQLIQRHVMGFLLPYVFRNRRLVESDGRYVIAFAPELAVAELVLEISMLLEHHKRAFTLQIPHEARHAHLGRYAHQHMHMVRHQMSLYDLNTFVGTEPAQDLADAFSVLVVDDLPSILGCEHDVVFTHPPRVRQAVCLLRHVFLSSYL